MCITSPPYFNLRDYEKDKQIGDEDTIEEYIKNICNVFEEVKRVLKPKGTLWVNIDDTYCNNNSSIVQRKSLQCIPDMFKIFMVYEMGWLCRNEIIWHKPNAMPSSAKDRFNQDYEKLYLFSKKPKYYFETQYEERLSEVNNNYKSDIENSKYKNINQESSVRQGMNKARGNKLIEKRDLLPHLEFVKKLKKNFTKKELYQVEGIKKTTIDHWFRKDENGFSYPKKEDWQKVLDFFGMTEYDINPFPELLEVYYETDDINKNSDKGRLKRSVWSINTKPFKESHFAVYPEELIEAPVKAGCPKDGIVLDPFFGSGTTGVVAKKLKRDFIGIDINEEYIKIAEKRLSEIS